MENTEDCSVVGCEFTDLDGNAVFVSKYGLNNEIGYISTTQINQQKPVEGFNGLYNYSRPERAGD